MSAIEWRREPRRILLPCLILAPFPIIDLSGIEARALIDTGSSVSGISESIAEQLNLSRLGKRPLRSAQGEGQIERYAFRVGVQPTGKAGEPNRFPFVFEEVIGRWLPTVRRPLHPSRVLPQHTRTRPLDQ